MSEQLSERPPVMRAQRYGVARSGPNGTTTILSRRNSRAWIRSDLVLNRGEIR